MGRDPSIPCEDTLGGFSVTDFVRDCSDVVTWGWVRFQVVLFRHNEIESFTGVAGGVSWGSWNSWLPLALQCWWPVRSALEKGQPKAVKSPLLSCSWGPRWLWGVQQHSGTVPQRNLEPSLDVPGWNSLWICLGTCTFLGVPYTASITYNSPSERI